MEAAYPPSHGAFVRGPGRGSKGLSGRQGTWAACVTLDDLFLSKLFRASLAPGGRCVEEKSSATPIAEPGTSQVIWRRKERGTQTQVQIYLPMSGVTWNPSTHAQRQEDRKFEASRGHTVRPWFKIKLKKGAERAFTQLPSSASLYPCPWLLFCVELRVTCRRSFRLLHGCVGYSMKSTKTQQPFPALGTAG